ncbi:MAG: hypothetical protein PHU91_04440 [Candidatus Omnitrophica bacterium]|nr:hypothetical protein [Candidatus Omnitrophota bacterium]MDD5236891.1 hypothetical protein [Candidatus Omnitrophota bacterium]MDD5610670.1 hypothetical protein [Candidatus Omnitrophota bacterium]
MNRKISDHALVAIFAALFCLNGIGYSFALDESKDLAITKLFHKSENEETAKTVKTTKTTEAKDSKTKSFKRFEITYEAIYLVGKYWEEAFLEDAAGLGVVGGIDLKSKIANRITSNTGVAKLAFYFTPKTSVEGAYGATYLNKKKYGYADIVFAPLASGTIDTQIAGKDVKFWSSDLYQNIYTHKKTGIAVDAHAGYSDYKMHVTINTVLGGIAGELVNATRSLSGYRVGMRFKAPIKLKKLPKHPMLFKFDISYTPQLAMKGDAMGLFSENASHDPLTRPGFTAKGKGDALEIHTGMTFQVTSFLGIEIAYNYYQFKIYKGRYEDVVALPTVLPPGIPLNADIKNTKFILHGPSVAAKVVF